MEIFEFYAVGPADQISREVDVPPFGPDVLLFSDYSDAEEAAHYYGTPVETFTAISIEQIATIIEAHKVFAAQAKAEAQPE